MNPSGEPKQDENLSPVDDVRRVREALSKRFGNDVRRLAEYARAVAEAQRAKLGCAPVKPPRAESLTPSDDRHS